jgi:phage terminase small subunit
VTQLDKTVLTDRELSIRERTFVAEYLTDFNATQAAIRAGYSEASARQTAHELIRKPHIEALIDKRVEMRLERLDRTADDVLIQMQRVAFADIRKIEPNLLGHLPDDIVAAIQSVKLSKRQSGDRDSDGKPIWENVVEFKLADKNAAIGMLGKHHKLLTDKVEHSGNLTTKQETRIVIVPAKAPLPDHNGNHLPNNNANDFNEDDPSTSLQTNEKRTEDLKS